MKLCECGCGQEVSKRIYRYVRYHHLPGRKLSEKHKKKIREANKRPCYEETKKKISKANKGRVFSEEHKKKLSIAKIGKTSPRKGAVVSEISKEKMRKAKIGGTLSKEHKKKIGESGKIAQNRPEVSAKRSKSLKAFWKISENKEKRISEMYRGMHISPNKPETVVLDILNKLHPNEWKFVGDGEVILAGRVPDFININGQKKIIELFGDYWHRGQDPQDRIKRFEPFGYKTLVIWEHELKNLRRVQFRINRFHRC